MHDAGIVSFTVKQHYVPQWHQRLFLSPTEKEAKLYYLDLKPDQVRGGDGKLYAKTDLWRWGPAKCFYQANLYTLAFGNLASDVIEKRFFGEIDRKGAEAVPMCADYELGKHGVDCLQTIALYMDAQKLRTPKGLDLLRTISPDGTHQGALYRMGQLSHMHVTMWMEGIWEILRCDNTPTKFILSDHPVTAYNKGVFPGALRCRYPFDPGIELLGTHTLFPLTPTRCLVITNLGYVRNPKAHPLEARQNPRMFANTIMFAGNVQTGRQLRDDQVAAINFIIKSRARRYIAAGREDWLYPEEQLTRKSWDKLGGKFFLSPDPREVSFSTGVFAGWQDGSSFGQDEYGRIPNDRDPRIKAQRALEWRTFHESRAEWEKHFGKLKHDPQGWRW
jgi:hypothetical protein